MVASESWRVVADLCYGPAECAGRRLSRSRRGKRTANRQNTLFCQRSVQKVEPILTPERLLSIDVRRRPEDLAVDRLLRQRLITLADVRGGGALGQRRGVESLLGCNRGQRVAFRDIPLLCPHRAQQGAGQLERANGALLRQRGQNPFRSERRRNRKMAWLQIERHPQ